jgi:hypothetical protein
MRIFEAPKGRSPLPRPKRLCSQKLDFAPLKDLQQVSNLEVLLTEWSIDVAWLL